MGLEDRVVNGQTRQSILFPALAAIVVGAVAFGTAAADAAWCGALARCIRYVPYAAIGGVLFDPLGALGALGIVIGLRINRVKLGPTVFVGIAVVMAILGFAFGMAPGINGQGP